MQTTATPAESRPAAAAETATRIEHAARLHVLRTQMKAHGIAAVLLPSADPHMSEYLAARWHGRRWLTGFKGSSGHLVVGLEEAALLVDSRYVLQAEEDLAGSGVQVQRISHPRAADAAAQAWLLSHVAPGGRVAAYGGTLSIAAAQALQGALWREDIDLITTLDLLDAVWPDRPGVPAQPVFPYEAPHAGERRAAKLERVRRAMTEAGASHHLVSAVDDVAWLLNLRGQDVPHNPVFLAHLLMHRAGSRLYVSPGQIDAELARQLLDDGVEVADYAHAPQAVRELPAGSRLLLDPQRVVQAMVDTLPSGVRRLEARNPSTFFKSQRNEQQCASLREAMVLDGVALCEFQAGLEQALRHGEPLTEADLHDRVMAARARHPSFRGPSFNTIAAFGPSAAKPHYRAERATALPIEGDGLLLIDSGGHYLEGTTDITRVWRIGEVSDQQRRDYSLVLKSMITLARTRFPRGTLGPMLDSLARAPLWAESLDFAHGTGHGVGHYLNVHEGPQVIAPVLTSPEMAMQPGMLTSIEPGLYREGRWGIRIENLALTVQVQPDSEFGEFLEFETMTLCPIELGCLAPGVLSSRELDWVRSYHATVRARLAPRLSGAALDWLLARTEPSLLPA